MTTKDRIYFEQTIIISILKDINTFMEVFNWGTNKEIFRIPEVRALFGCAMEYYFEYAKVPTISSLYEYLILSKSDQTLRTYLQTEVIRAKYSNKALDYVKLITENNIETELKEEISRAGNSGLDYAMTISEAASKIISKHTSSYSNTLSNNQIAQKVLENIEKAMKGEQTEYIPTGFESIDKNIIGIPKKHLTILASRPGMGKSQYMLQLMRNFRKQGVKCGIFSLEMESESLWHRNLSAETGIDSIKIERGDLTKEEFAKVKRAAAELSTDDYVIDDNGHQTPESIKAKINLWKANNQVDIIIIDYLTLISHKYDKERNDLNIGKLTSELRIFAKQSGIPIILLSQLNRAVEARTDKRPMLSDLRESGSIEQDAKLVMFLHRPIYYGIDPFSTDENNYFTQDGFSLKKEEYAEVIIRKARSGRVGIIPFRCILHLHKFEEVKKISSKNTN